MPPRTDVAGERRASSRAGAKQAAPSKRLYDPAAVRAHVSSWATADNGRAAWEAAVALAGYFLCFFLPWWTLPLHGMFAMRVFVVCVHDTAHGALFSSPRLNALLGSLTAPLTGMTYGYWQSGHAYHHRHSNDLDFLQTSQTAPLTSRGFAKLPAVGRGVYRWLSIPINLVTTGAPLAIMVAQPLSAERALDWALQLSWWATLYATGWWQRYLVLGFMTSALGLVLFHAQHTFPECERSHGKTATPMGYHENAILGSSFLLLDEWFKFFSVGIEYHHIHHLNAHVPCYNLRACHESAPAGMWTGVREITLKQGWETLKLVLWDEQVGRLISMAEYDQLYGADGAK